MRDPFGNSNKGRGWGKLLDFDSWIDSSLYSLFSGASDRWESITIWFRRFKVTGIRRFLVEIVDESITLGLGALLVLYALALPAFEQTASDWRNQEDFSVVMLDRNGKEIGQRGIRLNDSVGVDAMPDHFIKAVLATEDRRFFDHYGIDFYGLSRAMAENVRANNVVQGGSTITQQLAKNLFLSNERTLTRKINEAFLSLWLEINLDKKEILKLYLDRAYMGGGNFGIAAASQYYFGKDIKDISLAEAAMMAGLFKAPTKYAPHVNLPAARARANEVLTNMVQAGFLTEGQVIGARRNPAVIIERDNTEGPNYFLDYAYEEVRRIAARFKSRNLIVKTTVDLDLQNAAEESIESHLRSFGRVKGVSEAAMVVMDDQGYVRAIVGGRDYGKSQFNRATSAKRQPGSSFKPVVYASAIDAFGYTEKTRVIDQQVCVRRSGRKPWCPKNYSLRYRGRIDMATALVKSINTIPVQMYLGRGGFQALGGKRIEETARGMGIKSNLTLNPPMVLGSNGLTVLEMARAYGTFLRGGKRMRSHAVVQIQDTLGNTLYDIRKDAPPDEQVLKESTARAMNRMLVQIPERGTARRAALQGVRAAGKTGTTQAYRDAWFVGFTGNYIAAVWYGNDNYQPTKRLTGGNLPAMTWQKFMTYAHQNVKLRPIPFIENPLPADAIGTVANEGESAEDLAAPAIRPKTLSENAEQKLRDLNTIMKNAKPVKLNQKVASKGEPVLTSQ